MSSCPVCGGTLVGDGYTLVIRCENLDDVPVDIEPDAGPLYCNHLTYKDEQQYMAAYPYAVLLVEDPFTKKDELKTITRGEYNRQMARPDAMWNYRGMTAWYCDDMSEALQYAYEWHRSKPKNAPLSYLICDTSIHTFAVNGKWVTTLKVGEKMLTYHHHYWVEARLFFFALRHADFVEDRFAFANLLYNRS